MCEWEHLPDTHALYTTHTHTHTRKPVLVVTPLFHAALSRKQTTKQNTAIMLTLLSLFILREHIAFLGYVVPAMIFIPQVNVQGCDAIREHFDIVT